MSRSTHDYAALEREYVTTDISIRALAKKHDIKSWSTLNEQKKKRDWERKRADYQQQMEGRQIEGLVESRLKEVAAIHSELLYAIRAAVRRYASDLTREKDPQTVSARDLMGLIDKFLLLTGQATARSESRNLDAHTFDFGALFGPDTPPELLRELAELARENGAGSQPVGRGPLVVLEGTRSA